MLYCIIQANKLSDLICCRLPPNWLLSSELLLPIRLYCVAQAKELSNLLFSTTQGGY